MIPLTPDDEHNRTLTALVHPSDWTNPEPAERYNLVVIGAGTAGLVCAAGAAGLGAKVALVEKHLMGGDCLNYGCVPSKALLRAARAAADVRNAAAFGVEVPAGVRVNFPAVMERMRRLRARISEADSAARFRSLGVDVFIGEGRFTGPDAVEVGGTTLRFSKAVIATGGRAAVPPGFEGALTNETLFSLTELPKRLAVIGGGPIGCEMAQAFRRFGSEVTLYQAQDRLLPRDDAEASAIVLERFRKEGIDVVLNSRLSSTADVKADAMLVAAGRAPNVQGLNLEAAGVKFDTRSGVQADDTLCTTNPNIYAAGDIGSVYKFTHAADFMARIVIKNALFLGSSRVSALTLPWCTYTDPEVAHVGRVTPHTFVQKLDEVDRAILDGEEEGFVKVHLREGTDEIVGATVVARHAGELISELTLAIRGGVGLKTVADTIHPYPTQADAIRRTGDAYNRTRLTPFVRKIMGKWLAWRR